MKKENEILKQEVENLKKKYTEEKQELEGKYIQAKNKLEDEVRKNEQLQEVENLKKKYTEEIEELGRKYSDAKTQLVDEKMKNEQLLLRYIKTFLILLGDTLSSYLCFYCYDYDCNFSNVPFELLNSILSSGWAIFDN